MRTVLLALVTALTLATPVASLAYSTPEDVMVNTPFPRTDSFSARERQMAEELRRAQETARILAAQQADAEKAAHAAAGSSSSKGATAANSSSAPAATVGTPDGDTVTLEVDAATLRALVRLAERRTQNANTPTVHAGAPLIDEAPIRYQSLAPSGPEMWLAGLALIGAVGWTMHRARRLS